MRSELDRKALLRLLSKNRQVEYKDFIIYGVTDKGKRRPNRAAVYNGGNLVYRALSPEDAFDWVDKGKAASVTYRVKVISNGF